MKDVMHNGSADHIVIVGTGFSGLGMAIRLKQAGIDDFTIFERAQTVGGTWRDNHYPGAACDIESHLYSFSFELNPSWTRTFAGQREIQAYLEHCADKYDVRKHIRFGAAVTKAIYDEGSGLWTVESRKGDRVVARVLVAGTGGLSEPSYPDIAGLESFGGKTFHSSRWDDTYPLAGKTVGLIGTGASSIQIVPSIAPAVGQLHLFQRTPPWILPKRDYAIPVSVRDRFARLPALQRLARFSQYWRHEATAAAFVLEPRIMKLGGRLALRHMRSIVTDPALQAKLTPNYTMGCKRVLLTNDYYPAVQRSNVEVVTDPIRNITPAGVVTEDGRERKLDALILATGFTAADAVMPFDLRGRGGKDLNHAWRNGATAYLGTTISGFPNLFMMTGPNTGLGHNSMVFMIESQIAYVLSCVQQMRARGIRAVDVRADAQERYNASLQARLTRTVWSKGGCQSWYHNKAGKNVALWPGFTVEYRLRTRRWDPTDYDVVSS